MLVADPNLSSQRGVFRHRFPNPCQPGEVGLPPRVRLGEGGTMDEPEEPVDERDLYAILNGAKLGIHRAARGTPPSWTLRCLERARNEPFAKPPRMFFPISPTTLTLTLTRLLPHDDLLPTQCRARPRTMRSSGHTATWPRRRIRTSTHPRRFARYERAPCLRTLPPPLSSLP